MNIKKLSEINNPENEVELKRDLPEAQFFG